MHVLVSPQWKIQSKLSLLNACRFVVVDEKSAFAPAKQF
jgi:hypothetical protein